jgi:hypothetical protein
MGEYSELSLSDAFINDAEVNYDYDKKDIDFDYTRYWKRIDGTLIEIKDMTTLHIENCIKQVLKANSFNPYLVAELNRREEENNKILKKLGI